MSDKTDSGGGKVILVGEKFLSRIKIWKVLLNSWVLQSLLQESGSGFNCPNQKERITGQCMGRYTLRVRIIMDYLCVFVRQNPVLMLDHWGNRLQRILSFPNHNARFPRHRWPSIQHELVQVNIGNHLTWLQMWWLLVPVNHMIMQWQCSQNLNHL